MKKGIIIMVALLLTLLTSCSDKEVDLTKGKYGVIYTSSSDEKSIFATIDEQGRIQSQAKFKSMGVFQIVPDEQGGYIFPSYFTIVRTHIEPDGKIKLSHVRDQTSFFMKEKDMEINLFNSDIETNTLEVKKGKQSNKLVLPGVFEVATADQSHIYLTSDLVHKEKDTSQLYVVDHRKNKLIRKIPFREASSNDIRIINGKIVIALGDQYLSTIDLDTWKVEDIKLPKKNPYKIITDQDDIYLTTEKGWVMRLDQNFKVKETVKLDKIYHARIQGVHFYIFNQLNEKERYGYIKVYDKKTWKKKKEVFLPNLEDELLVQDFVLLDHQ
ncbi:hypothetical protein GXN76_14005 [Kroppenstedtia pulmonis]|uniref:Lipoprotein n=1 Tax=Kroppenstedtia pulmonis TaxID=1380685 RepID=A0A7D4BIJ3_9BACL|nr:hypothetical protein [Kroppenstedtia pulmonis]QKG85455.1 hypothetical protein GXN76_14005 [Kroppenstedtia pulmonis]